MASSGLRSSGAAEYLCSLRRRGGQAEWKVGGVRVAGLPGRVGGESREKSESYYIYDTILRYYRKGFVWNYDIYNFNVEE